MRKHIKIADIAAFWAASRPELSRTNPNKLQEIAWMCLNLSLIMGDPWDHISHWKHPEIYFNLTSSCSQTNKCHVTLGPEHYRRLPARDLAVFLLVSHGWSYLARHRSVCSPLLSSLALVVGVFSSRFSSTSMNIITLWLLWIFLIYGRFNTAHLFVIADDVSRHAPHSSYGVGHELIHKITSEVRA